MTRTIRPSKHKLTDSWFKIGKPRLGSGDVDVLLYGEIGGWGISALEFRNQLMVAVNSGASRVVVHINSPGGTMWDSVAIYNILRGLAIPVMTYVDSLAASGASLVAMAGNPVVMAEGTFMMIHNPAVDAWGNQHALEEITGVVANWAEALAQIYAGKTGLSVEMIRVLMDAETWLSADQALALKFCDKKDAAMRVAAYLPDSMDSGAFGKFPQGLIDLLPHLPNSLRQAQIDEVTLLIEEEEVMTKDVEVKAEDLTAAAVELIRKEAKEVAALCQLAGKPEMAAGFIAEGKTAEEVMAALLALPKSVVIITSAAEDITAVDSDLDYDAIFKRWNAVPTARLHGKPLDGDATWAASRAKK